jgi:hypothetical protein
MPISVKPLDSNTFEVTVESRTTTIHIVTVDQTYAQKLTGGQIPTAQLIERSFEFLLEREPNTSILRQFDLPVIGRYFPEYERTIKTVF